MLIVDDRLFEEVSAASPSVQASVVEASILRTESELPQIVQDILSGKSLPGDDIMVQTPAGQALANELDEIRTAIEAGRTTISEEDIAFLQSRVESLVKLLVAQGKSDDEIQQAIGQLASNPDLATIAQTMAQQQLDAEKFNLFSARNEPQQAVGQEASPNPFAALLTGVTLAPELLALNATNQPLDVASTIPGKQRDQGIGMGSIA